MHIYKVSFALAVLAASTFVGSTYSFADQEPQAAARQAEVDADMAKSKIQDIEAAEDGADAADDNDTPQELSDAAKIHHQDQNLYRAQEREQAAEEEEGGEDSED